MFVVTLLHCLLLSCICSAYTRTARQVSFKSKDGSAVWLDVVSDVVLETDTFTTVGGATASNDIYYKSLLKCINGARSSYGKLLNVCSKSSSRPGSWERSSVDTSASTTEEESRAEICGLLSGKLQPKQSCSFENPDRKHCSFADTVSTYRIYTPIPYDSLDLLQWSYLFDLADDLFNAELESHAEAWTYNLLAHLHVGMVADDIEEELETMTAHQHRLLMRGSLLLAEAARLKGDLAMVAHHGVRIIHSGRALAGEATAADRKTSFVIVARLRVLLAMPPVPPDYDTARRYRQEMIEDLQVFAENARKNRWHVSLEELSAHISATPFHMAHQGLNDLDFQAALAGALLAICPQLQYIAPHALAPQIAPVYAPDGTPTRRIKVGFISTYFTDHSIGRILAELLIILAPARSLDVYVYMIDRRIPSDVTVTIAGDKAKLVGYTDIHLQNDFIPQQLRRVLGEWAVRLPDNLAVIRQVLSAAQLDLLIFTDVGMDFTTYQLAFSRFAPVQAVWWGHPITTALPTMDYFISLDEEVEHAQAHYLEQLVRMEHINAVPLAAPWSSRLKRWQVQHQLMVAEDQTVAQLASDDAALLKIGFTAETEFCMVLGRLFKLHPAFDEILVSLILAFDRDRKARDIADSVEMGPVIVLIAESISEVNAIIYDRLHAALVRRLRQEEHWQTAGEKTQEVEGAATEMLVRVVKVLGYSHYHYLLRSARVVLDTFPYGGCITTHDALIHSVPMVTLPSEFIRGRFTLSMYKAMNITALIASSPTHYVDIVVRLMKDDSFWLAQAQDISQKIMKFVSTNNHLVAQEWASFIENAVN